VAADNCQRCREELTALRHGELAEVPETALREHLVSCPACREAQRHAAAVADLLGSCQPPLPPGGFDRLCAALAALAERSHPASQPAPRGRVIPLSAAAAVAAAAFLLALWLGAALIRRTEGQRPPAPAAVLTDLEGAATLAGSKEPVRAGVVLKAGAVVGLEPGARARLVLNPEVQVDLAGGSSVEILAGDRLRLAGGKLLAVVEKGGAGFRVSTPDAEVVTLGTRFAVEASGTLTRVTVIDGRVRFRSAAGSPGGVQVSTGQSSSVVGGCEPSEPSGAPADALAWLLSAPAPRVELELVLAKAEIPPGQRLTARLLLTNRSGAPVALDGPARPMPAYFLRLTDPAGRNSYACPAVTAAVVDGQSAAGPALDLRPDSVCQLDLDLGALLDVPGDYRLAIIYFGSLRSAAGMWSGVLESRTVTVQVKAPAVRQGSGASELQKVPRSK